MLVAEDLLSPIEPAAPAGHNLRYDPVYDQIAEARSEEDATLPVGAWARQTKKADYPHVLFLSREALLKRSKDLWLAAWLGEAQIKLDGLNAVPVVLNLLLGLQEHFWDSLYPKIEDDDLGMRGAPLQWAMERYSSLVYDLPAIAESVSYREYEALRRGGLSGADAQPMADRLDAALQRTGKAFYVSAESQLAATRTALEKLYLFCNDRYRDDGPSFVRLRTAVDEVHNVVASQLRAKREQDPDPVESAAPEPEAPALSEAILAQEEMELPLALRETVPEAGLSWRDYPTVDVGEAAPQKAESLSSDHEVASAPQSWEMALEQIQQCAVYLSQERPASPAPYLVLSALQMDGIDALKQPPSTELRMSLRKASREGSAHSLLEESLRALLLPVGAGWLDLHRYIWSASQQMGHDAIAESVLDVIRVMLRKDDAIAESVFEDDTPTASEETRQWIATEVRRRDNGTSVPEQVASTEVAQALPQPAPVAHETPDEEQNDVWAQAEALATGGQLAASVELLMQDAAASPARRISFQRRLQASRLCLACGRKVAARRLLGQLLIEADEYRLELWEGSHLVGEVIVMLLQSLDDNEIAEREVLLARLCQIDPARAISVEARN